MLRVIFKASQQVYRLLLDEGFLLGASSGYVSMSLNSQAAIWLQILPYVLMCHL